MLAGGVTRDGRDRVGTQLQPVRVELTDPNLVPHAFLVTGWVGRPVNAAPDEHDALGWFTARDLSGLRLADPGYHDWLPTLIDTGPPRALG